MTDQTLKRLQTLVLAGLIGLIVIAVFRHYRVTVVLQRDAIPGDFAIFWLLAKLATLGQDVYDMGIGRETYAALITDPGVGWFSTRWLAVTHPPSEAVVFYPFAQLPWETAMAIWRWIIQILWFACIGWMSVQIWQHTQNAIKVAVFVALSVLFIPAQFSLQLGQLDMLHLLGMLASLWCLQREKSYLSGAIIGFLAITKPTPVLMLGLFLLRKDWKAIVGACATALTIMGISVLWLGIDPWFIWLGEVLPELTLGSSYFGNYTFTGMGYHLFSDPVTWKTFTPPADAVAAQWFGSIFNWMALAGIIWIIWRFGRNRNPYQLAGVFWLFVLYMLLTGKVAWGGYFVWCIPAFAFLLWKNDVSIFSWQGVVLYGSMLFAYVLLWLPPRYYQLPDVTYAELWITRLLIPLKVYGTLILAGLMVWHLNLSARLK